MVHIGEYVAVIANVDEVIISFVDVKFSDIVVMAAFVVVFVFLEFTAAVGMIVVVCLVVAIEIVVVVVMVLVIFVIGIVDSKLIFLF